MRYEVRLPELYTGMTEQDKATLTRWYAQEHEVVLPDELLVRVETPASFIDIPLPYSETCRVVQVHKQVGEEIHLGDLLVTVETMEEREHTDSLAPN